MLDPLHLVLILLGGAAGGIGRYAVSGFVGRRVGETFPWGTLVVNGSGALGLGVLAAWIGAAGGGDAVWIAAAVGVFGSYTTVSSFSLQTLALARDGEWLPAAFNILGSLALCLGAAFVGYLAGGALWGAP
jgi:fluoride exporter